MLNKKVDHQIGFTLLEILIALFIFVIVSAITTSTLHSILKTEQRVANRAAELRAVQIALILLSRDIQQAIDRPVENINNQQEGFIGNDHAITFTRTGWMNPEGRLPRSTLQRVGYRLQNQVLLRESWSVLDPISNAVRGQRYLLSYVTGLRFDYLDQKGRFYPVWPPPTEEVSPPALPKAVRVTIRLADWGDIHQLYLVAGQPLNDDKTKSS